MASAPKKAIVTKREMWRDDTVQITCEMKEPSALGFVGGKYIIINSKRLLANGKMGKRAYSIASPDSKQGTFELAVKRIPGGVGSGFIHDLPVGGEFEFSGPWGKFVASENMSREERVLCIATDTGITAALGLLQSEQRFRIGFRKD
jgi:ferredoxin-NADP reductase